MEQLRKEKNETPPYVVFTITDGEGQDSTQDQTGSPSAGIHQTNWDLRYDSPFPVKLKNDKFDPTAFVFFFNACCAREIQRQHGYGGQR